MHAYPLTRVLYHYQVPGTVGSWDTRRFTRMYWGATEGMGRHQGGA